MDVVKKYLMGPQPLTKVVKIAKISSASLPRDTASRREFINSMHLENYFPKNDLQLIQDRIDKLDVGHIVGRCEGGSNNLENFILEDKNENREPGLKRYIERENAQMLLSGKKVYNEFVLYFDKRNPIRVPAFFQIKQTIKWKNGQLYQKKIFEMSNQPYLEFVTMPEMRNLLVKSDLKVYATQALCTAGYCGVLKFTSKNQSTKDKLIGATKTAVKTAMPYIGIACVKGTLDFLQTSKFLSKDAQKKVALVNVNPYFNTGLNNTAKLLSFKLLKDELGKVN